MKWLTLAGILLYLSKHSEAGALKCTPESQEVLCASEKRDIYPVQSLIEREKEIASADTQCLAGSEWESNCHYCRCSDSGIAECLKQDSCNLQIYEEPIKCKPFTTFRRDCNTCTCLKNGLGLCTLIGCFVSERRKRQMQCQPGSTWKSSCNTCRCLENGGYVCTKRGCSSDYFRPLKACSPGTEWKNDCNSCHCTSEGQPICTELKCNSIESSNVEKRETSKSALKATQNHIIAKRGVCKPNQEFQVDCNPCKCATNGLSYTCTHNECLEGDNTNKEVEVFMESEGTDHIERHSVCKPRDTFYVGCNTCHCNPFGTDYSCTNKPCPLPEDVEIFHELKENTTKSSNNTKQVVCVANRMFIRDCNTCWCNEDGTSFFCTRRICTPGSTDEDNKEDPESEVKLRVVKKECRPNEVFEMNCNMCRCNPDGKSYSCTRRACVEIDDKNVTLTRQTRAVQEPPKTCQPGTEFRMDCNKCLCNDEGQDFSCTRIDCAAQNNNGGVDSFASTRSKRELSEQVSTQCVPGSVFDRECNVCRCTTDGLHAVCTLKRCKQETTEAATEPTPSFRCTPGDQFKRDCNDCTCSADGKTVFCTLRFCDQVLADI